MISVQRVFVVAAVLFGAAALGLLGLDAHIRSSCSEPVSAVVVENVVWTSGGKRGRGVGRGGTKTVAPVFAFEFGGRSFRVESSTSSWPPAHEVGEQARLFVDPEDPESFREDGDNTLRVVAAVFGAFLVVFSAAAAFVRVGSRRGNI